MLILFKKQILLVYTKFTDEYERYLGILVLVLTGNHVIQVLINKPSNHTRTYYTEYYIPKSPPPSFLWGVQKATTTIIHTLTVQLV